MNVYMRRAQYPRVPGPAALRPAHKVLPSFCPAALCNQEGLKERKLGALHQALGMYQQRLGLEFQHGDADGEQLRVVMTQVDARDPARPFTFAVQVMGDNSYAGEWAGGGQLAIQGAVRQLAPVSGWTAGWCML